MSQTSHPDHPHLPTGADVARIDGLARLLIESRTDRAPIDEVPPELVPGDAVEAQLVDDHVAAVSGWEQRGWKIGATSTHAQELLGSDGPFAGRVYTVFADGAELGPDDLAMDPLVEGEFAFVLAADLEPIDRPRRRDEVIAAVGELRPAIELVGGRYRRFVGQDLPLLIADAGANVHLVLGEPVSDADLEALAGVAAEMTVDGEVTGGGTGADVLGDPITALTWLADNLSDRGIALRAGQVVTTGTATQVAPLPAGATATVRFGGLGSASVARR